MLAKLWPQAMYNKHPDTFRQDCWDIAKATERAGVHNGVIGVKHWPVDTYKLVNGGNLEAAIEQGTILNDPGLFIELGLMQHWKKDFCKIDTKEKTLKDTRTGRSATFDIFVDAGRREQPRVPPIVRVYADGTRVPFKHAVRDSLLGMVPKALSSVYMLGLMRPSSGGASNLSEMQALFIHKMITQEAFRQATYKDIEGKIADYNELYYKGKPLSTDNVVFYGLYVQDVANSMGLRRNWSDCISSNPLTTLNKLRFELFYPCNPLKYRMEGEYRVDGAAELAKRIDEDMTYFLILPYFHLSSLWDTVMVFQLLWLLFWALQPAAGVLTFPLFASIASVAYFIGDNLLVPMLISYSLPLPFYGLKTYLQPFLIYQVASRGSLLLSMAYFGIIFAIIWISRTVFAPPNSSRYLFADLNFKLKFKGFWEQYLVAYKKVNGKGASQQDKVALGEKAVEAVDSSLRQRRRASSSAA